MKKFITNKSSLQVLMIWIATLQFVFIFIGWTTHSVTYLLEATIVPEVSAAEEHVEPSINSLKKMKPKEAIEFWFGKDSQDAEAVSFCESGLNPEAESNSSSASGLFQIIDGTWSLFKCEGDPYNAHDNVSCAKTIFDHTGGWNTSGGWAASYACHQKI